MAHKIHKSTLMVMSAGGYVGGGDEPIVNEEPMMPLLPDQQKPKTQAEKPKTRCGAGYTIDEEVLMPTSVKWKGGKK